ncbi:hypothetical protein X798_02893 [Onchocerca flexuosa]|uniref:Galactosyltransferase C-terminal domain-containing protein n=1 Tax=Onchocerca flexuosa TaxID=387005 RepID=A0A238BZ24_9BILA|nr:hypothetical protein X798_02893 [Onchocerca flexuosa]
MLKYLTNFIFEMLNKVPKIANHFPSIKNCSIKIADAEIVGDVLAIFMDHFNIVNEFFNEFWGWGGGDEADEMGLRILKLNMT